jgi:peptide deformylase
VLDVRGVTDRPSTLELEGKPVDVEKIMPLVLINPELKPLNDPVAGPEGCLSFPEISGEILRASHVKVKGKKTFHFRARIWEGKTAAGVPCIAWIALIGCKS